MLKKALALAAMSLMCGGLVLSAIVAGTNRVLAEPPITSIEVVPPNQSSAKRCQRLFNDVDFTLRARGGRIVANGVRFSYVTRSDNPTGRNRQVMIVIGSRSGSLDSVNALMGSPMLSDIARSVASTCPDVASVSFGLDRSDYIVEFALDGNGQIFGRTCIDPGPGIVPTWREQICL